MCNKLLLKNALKYNLHLHIRFVEPQAEINTVPLIFQDCSSRNSKIRIKLYTLYVTYT